jgi:SWI/SNF-related matrix-associated actin-dependent regulator 1 of chromatin subfamily A
MLKKHQREAVLDIIDKNYCAILADEMGLGKTITAISAAVSSGAKRVFVLCPAGIMENWRCEIQKFENVETVFFIESYDTFKNKAYSPNCDFLILDESHYIKNPNSGRFKAVKKYFLHVKNKLLLSGTPVMNRPAELWTQLYLLHSGKYINYTHFVRYFNGGIKVGRSLICTRPTNCAELKRTLKKFLIARKFNDVYNIPPIQQIYVRHAKPEKYDLEAKALGKELAKIQTNKSLVLFNEHRRKLAMRRASRDAKIINSLDGKVLVFCHHIDVLDTMAEELGAIKITSKDSAAVRVQKVNQWKNSNVKCLCGTIGTIGTGLNMEFCSNVWFMECAWTPGLMEQCVGRVRRLTNFDNEIKSYVSFTRDTVEEAMIKLVAKKDNNISSLMKKSDVLKELYNQFYGGMISWKQK